MGDKEGKGTMSQLQAVCERLRIKAEAEYGGVEVPEGWTPGTHPYKVRLRFQGRKLTVPFYMGPAHSSEPTAADVLACLVSDARAGDQSFEEFCSDFGYDADSRKAESTWKQCASLAPRIRRFLGDAFDEVEAAEH
jgi:hypothetical protein